MTDTTVNLSESNNYEASNELDVRGNEGTAPQHKEIEQGKDTSQTEEKPKPESRIDAIKRAADDVAAKETEKEPKGNPSEQPKLGKESEESEEPKMASDKSEPVADKQQKPSEGRRLIEAPARLLPRAKELWNNVPHPVREEWERISKENEAEIEKYKESAQLREELREYEELGKQNGVSLKQALDNYVGIERKFASDPAEGFKQLFNNLGMNPQQAISHILRGFGVSPQALAQHINQSPNEYTALARQQQAQPQVQQHQPQQTNAEVAQLRQQVMQMQQQSINRDVVEPFAREYPQFSQHQDQIAKVLESGIIEQIHGNGLSPRDKLEAALFMVAPHAAKSQTNPVHTPSPESLTPAVELRGNQSKSVKGSPTPGLDNSGRKTKSTSRQDAIKAAMSELGIG